MPSSLLLAEARHFKGCILMFGLSRDTRWRMEEAERIAKEARDIGNKAIATIAEHLAGCKPLQEDTKRRLGAIEDQNTWQTRGIITMLLLMLGSIIGGGLMFYLGHHP